MLRPDYFQMPGCSYPGFDYDGMFDLQGTAEGCLKAGSDDTRIIRIFLRCKVLPVTIPHKRITQNCEKHGSDSILLCGAIESGRSLLNRWPSGSAEDGDYGQVIVLPVLNGGFGEGKWRCSLTHEDARPVEAE